MNTQRKQRPAPEDPILAVIAAHKAAYAAYGLAIDHSEAPGLDKRRRIEAERAVIRSSKEADRIAIDLLVTTPTTSEGIFALIEYAVTHDTSGTEWPHEWEDSEGLPRSWCYRLLQNVLKAMRKGVAA
jgi:hypothetical protein